MCHGNFVHDSNCIVYASWCHTTTKVACQFIAWQILFCQYFYMLVSCTYLIISVLSIGVSALVFNSKLDNCTVSKDCEFWCFCGMDMHKYSLLNSNVPLLCSLFLHVWLSCWINHLFICAVLNLPRFSHHATDIIDCSILSCVCLVCDEPSIVSYNLLLVPTLLNWWWSEKCFQLPPHISLLYFQYKCLVAALNLICFVHSCANSLKWLIWPVWSNLLA